MIARPHQLRDPSRLLKIAADAFPALKVLESLLAYGTARICYWCDKQQREVAIPRAATSSSRRFTESRTPVRSADSRSRSSRSASSSPGPDYFARTARPRSVSGRPRCRVHRQSPAATNPAQ